MVVGGEGSLVVGFECVGDECLELSFGEAFVTDDHLPLAEREVSDHQAGRKVWSGGC